MKAHIASSSCWNTEPVFSFRPFHRHHFAGIQTSEMKIKFNDDIKVMNRIVYAENEA